MPAVRPAVTTGRDTVDASDGLLARNSAAHRSRSCGIPAVGAYANASSAVRSGRRSAIDGRCIGWPPRAASPTVALKRPACSAASADCATTPLGK